MIDGYHLSERMNTDDSRIFFLPGEREKECVVALMGDTIFEKEEDFKLVLGSPASEGDRYNILLSFITGIFSVL